MKKDTAEDAPLGLYAWKHTFQITHIKLQYNREKKKYLFNSVILVITSNIQQLDKEFIWYSPCYIISLEKCHHFVDILNEANIYILLLPHLVLLQHL